MEYARFEGIIPKGEYGGGTVMVWDIGTYELIDGNYWKGKLHISVDGKKLKGEWVFVKGHEENGKENTWYLIKTGASMARLPERKENSSALTGRTLEQISKAEDAVWHSNRNGHQESPKRNRPILDLESLPKVRVGFMEPMLARSVSDLPPDDREWLYEIKLDGYRCLIGKSSNKVTLWSRRLLQHHRSKAQAIQFYAFDLLIYKGRSLSDVALETRRELLTEALSTVGDPIRLSEAFETTPADLIRAAKEQSLEGIVAKRKDSIYEPRKRSGAWLKYRINRGQEFVIGGYTPDHPFDALIVGYYKDGDLYYVGKVRNGFVPQVRREVYRKFKGLEIDTCPFVNLPEKKRTMWALTREEMKNCRWLKPELVAQIEFAEWTPDGHLRHSRFVGLREDKEPPQIVREV
jgi:bifunctional non-homologous end joining protein LigD